MNLQAVQDKIEIKELLYRYARACDRKDWKLLPSDSKWDRPLSVPNHSSPAGSTNSP